VRTATESYLGTDTALTCCRQHSRVLRMTGAVRWILLGGDDSIGARLFCSPRAIVALACVALLLHMLDLLSGIQMMQHYGLHTEQNPVARMLFGTSGPIGLSAAKFTVVGTGVVLMVWLALHGRARLARNALLLVAILGLLGFASNQI
jgi:uncharacterized protein DUF5658